MVTEDKIIFWSGCESETRGTPVCGLARALQPGLVSPEDRRTALAMWMAGVLVRSLTLQVRRQRQVPRRFRRCAGALHLALLPRRGPPC